MWSLKEWVRETRTSCSLMGNFPIQLHSPATKCVMLNSDCLLLQICIIFMVKIISFKFWKYPLPQHYQQTTLQQSNPSSHGYMGRSSSSSSTPGLLCAQCFRSSPGPNPETQCSVTLCFRGQKQGFRLVLASIPSGSGYQELLSSLASSSSEWQ